MRRCFARKEILLPSRKYCTEKVLHEALRRDKIELYDVCHLALPVPPSRFASAR